MEVIENVQTGKRTLKNNDIVMSIDEIATKSIEELIKELKGKKVRETVSIVVKDKKEVRIDLTLAKIEM